MQTAMQSHIQWLYDNQLELNIPIEVIEDAEDRLEMEKQQIIDTFDKAYMIGYNDDGLSGINYFAETYGSNGSDEKNGNNVEEVPNVTFFQTTSDKWKEYQDWLNEIPEISDEEIWNEAKIWALEELITSVDSFVDGAKWYREQLKKKI